MNQIAHRSETIEEQLVVFQLAGEAYGVDIAYVQSIIQMQKITTVPGAPDFIEGIINLRGSVVPIVDLRTRFDLPPPAGEEGTVIIIVELDDQQVGMVVDKVTDVIEIPEGAIEPPSPLLISIDTAYLRGIAKLEEQMVILLNVDRVFTVEEQQALKQTTNEATSE